MNKKIILVPLFLSVVGGASYFIYHFNKPKNINMGEASLRRVQISEESKYFSLFQENKWDELQNLLFSEASEKDKYDFLKQTQFLVDSKKILNDEQSRENLQSLLINYMDKVSASEVKGDVAKNLILAGKIIGKVGDLTVDSPNYKTLIKWMNSDKEYMQNTSFSVISKMRKAPQELSVNIKKLLKSKDVQEVKTAIYTINAMLDFEMKSGLIKHMEQVFFSVESSMQPSFFKTLIANEKQLKNPEKLIQHIMKNDGNVWEEAFLFSLENSEHREKYINELKSRQKKYKSEILQARAQRILALYSKDRKK